MPVNKGSADEQQHGSVQLEDVEQEDQMQNLVPPCNPMFISVLCEIELVSLLACVAALQVYNEA